MKIAHKMVLNLLTVEKTFIFQVERREGGEERESTGGREGEREVV